MLQLLDLSCREKELPGPAIDANAEKSNAMSNFSAKTVRKPLLPAIIRLYRARIIGELIDRATIPVT